MKKLISFPLFFLLITISAIGQGSDNDSIAKNELKIDAFSLIVYKYIDFSYERLLNEEASFGMNIQFTFDSEQENLGYVKQFSVTPFYRQYFSKKYATGFFVEGFATYASVNDYYYFYEYDSVMDISNEDYMNDTYNAFALGISIGGKFVTQRGFVVEIFAGIGRNLLDIDNEHYYRSEIIGRGGLTLGYRF
ncbi:MAG: DUF3575 domain-containing protein [Flavobacteriaceae bacterium]